MYPSTSVRQIIAAALLLIVSLGATAESDLGPAELGILAIREKDYALALTHFEKALTQNPDAPFVRHNACTAHQGLANEFAQAGDISKAIKQVEVGLKIDPENSAARIQLGSYCLETGQIDDAVEHLRHAFSLLPSDPTTQFLLGEAYTRQQDFDSAREIWGALLKAKPRWPGLQEKYSALMRESGTEKASATANTARFELTYAKALPEETRSLVLTTLEEAYKTVGEELGGLYPAESIEVLLLDGEKFPEAIGSPGHLLSIQEGKIRAPITSRNGRFVSPGALKAQLTHEYIHVLLAAHMGINSPWWLNEGLADTLSREMDGTRKRVLGTAYRGGSAHALTALETSDFKSAGQDAMPLAFAQAHATVDYLWKRGGSKDMAAFIKTLQSGSNPQDALRSVYKMDYARLEAEVAKSYP